MADEREFKIKIITIADTKAAVDEKHALEDLDPAVASYKKNWKAATEETEKGELSHRQLVRGIRMVSPELAHLAHAGFFATLGPMGMFLVGIAAITKGFEFMAEESAKTKEALEKRIDFSNIKAITRALAEDGLIKALEDGEVEAGKFWAKIERLSKAEGELKAQTDEAVEALKRQAQEEKGQADAAEKRDLAKIEAQEKGGFITHEEAEKKKAAIQDAADKKRDDIESTRARKEIEARKKEREDQAKVIDEGRGKITGKEMASEHANASVEAAKKELETWKKTYEELQNYEKEFGKRLTPEQEAAEMQKRRFAFANIAKAEQETVPAREVAAANAKDELDEERRRVEAATKRKGELDREIPRMESESASADKSRGVDRGAKRDQRGFEEQGRAASTPMGKMIKDVADAEATLQKGGQISTKQQGEIAALSKRMADAHMAHGEQVLKGLGTVHSNTDLLMKRVAELTRKLEAQGHQIRNSHNP